MPTDPQVDVEARLRLLEEHAEVQSMALTALHAERIEAERLTESVSRLGMSADDLGAALLQVDQNQQTLTRLGRQLQDVENKAATTEDVEHKVRVAKAEVDQTQQATRRRIVQSVMILTLMLLVVSVGVTEYLRTERAERLAECQRSQATGAAVTQFLNTVAENSQVPEIKRSAQDVIDNLPRRTACQ